LYRGAQHEEALANLIYGVQSRKGFIVLTGEVGTGKTTVLTAFAMETRIATEEMLEEVCRDLLGLRCGGGCGKRVRGKFVCWRAWGIKTR